MAEGPGVPRSHASWWQELLHSRRFLQVVYWGSAAILAPWIAILFAQQPIRGHAYHFRLVGAGAAVFLVLGILATATACRRHSRMAVVTGVSTATLAFITAWFSTVTATGGRFTVALLVAVIVQLPIVVVCAIVAARCVDPGGTRPFTAPRWAVATLLGAAIAVLPLIALLGTAAPSIRAVDHLRLVWTGLDVLELAGLATTAWCVRRRLPGVAVAAAFTGTLLFSDAWINVAATTGRAQLAAVIMAGAELPLAALSLYVARSEVRAWPDGPVEGAPGAPGTDGRRAGQQWPPRAPMLSRAASTPRRR